MDLVWAQVINDPFLRRLILRYLFSSFYELVNVFIYFYCWLVLWNVSWLPLRLVGALLKLKLLNRPVVLHYLSTDSYSADPWYLFSAHLKKVNYICRFAYPIYLLLLHQSLKLCDRWLCNLPSTLTLLTLFISLIHKIWTLIATSKLLDLNAGVQS